MKLGGLLAVLVFMLWLGGLQNMQEVRADEGMWLLTDPPRQHLKEKYGFVLSDEWLEHAQKASVRFNNGGSGGFVSEDGLIVTNHHIGADALQKLSSKNKDYLRDGFLAKNRADELKCSDLELNVLQSMEDVTDRINAAVTQEMPPAKAFAARRARMAEVEEESRKKTGLRSDIVTLYHGGLYHLYCYKKYTDIRLVMAPEQAIASFGGDTDNFEFPRFNLDVCFFRAYENDKPVKVQHYLRWSPDGPTEGDLVFVTGHPGTTQRLETLAKLKHRRDITLPFVLNRLRSQEASLLQFSGRGPEQALMAAKDHHRVANARKAISGQYQGLLDPAVLERKAKDEQMLRDKIAGDPATQKEYGSAWKQIEEAERTYTEFEKHYLLIEDNFESELLAKARQLVRMPVEKEKPSTERLREYRDSNLESLEFQLYSPTHIHAEYERARLAHAFTFLAENLGGAHPFVVKVLAGKSPSVRAEEIVGGTKLFDPAERRKVVVDVATVEKSTDSAILFARLIDDDGRKLRKRYEDEVEEVERQAYAQIARARFALYGKGIAPDATFTLRLAFGVVKGYKVAGTDLPYTTTWGGAFDRADIQKHREPFTLPKRWMDAKDKIDLKTPFNFVSTADTIGGNSGSPVLNRKGELVGINFDRNRHGLVRNFVYTDEQARHISVHSRGVLEAAKHLYHAEELVKELTGNK